MRESGKIPGSFAISWEQRKFEELYTKSSEKNDGSIGVDRNITVATMQFKKDVQVSTSDYLKTYYTFKLGDIAFEGHQSKEFRYGRFVENDIGDGIVSHIFAVFRPIQQYDLFFWKYAINNESLMQRILSRSTKASTMMHDLVTNDFLKETFLVPSIEEQKQIGTFLNKLDNIITLHQRKLRVLCILERLLYENIKQFEVTVSWEQRKLSEIADKVTEKNSGLQYVETFTNSAEFGIISQRDFFDHDIAKLSSLDGYYIVKNEDFVYNPRISTSAPVGPINRNKLGRTGVMSPLYTVFRPHDIDTTYLEYFFKCGYWHSFMNFNGDSGARSDRFSIKDNVFFQMPIPIPHLDEQRKIGKLLTRLDNLITLHQRKP